MWLHNTAKHMGMLGGLNSCAGRRMRSARCSSKQATCKLRRAAPQRGPAGRRGHAAATCRPSAAPQSCLTAWNTVLWSRPPRARPISVSASPMSSRMTYMARCRACETVRSRLGPFRAAAVVANSRAACSITPSAVCTTGSERVSSPPSACSHQVHGHGPPRHVGVRRYAVQASLKLADAVARPPSQRLHHLRWHIDVERRRLGPQDREPRLEVGRLNVGDQPPLEPRPQSVVQRFQRPRRPVAGQHHLAARVVKLVEDVEQSLPGSAPFR